MRALAKLRELSPAERRELIRALFVLHSVQLALHARGLAYVRAVVSKTPLPAGPSELQPAQIARLVGIAARHGPLRASCMVRSLALQRLLARRGIPSVLRIGVRKAEGRLEAHAWVEHASEPLGEPVAVAEDYAPFEPISRVHP